MQLSYQELNRDELVAKIPALAKLRIEVFAEYPYLYDGDAKSEAQYLQTLVQSSDAFVIAAFAGATLVGASTGMPMSDAHSEFQNAFEQTSFRLDELYYCAESVLLPEYRGMGAGHVFFNHRETHARRLGKRYSCFCAVVRSTDDTRKPVNYSPLDTFWRKRGYESLDGVTTQFWWQEHGENGESPKSMQFWIHDLQHK